MSLGNTDAPDFLYCYFWGNKLPKFEQYIFVLIVDVDNVKLLRYCQLFILIGN